MLTPDWYAKIMNGVPVQEIAWQLIQTIYDQLLGHLDSRTRLNVHLGHKEIWQSGSKAWNLSTNTGDKLASYGRQISRQQLRISSLRTVGVATCNASLPSRHRLQLSESAKQGTSWTQSVVVGCLNDWQVRHSQARYPAVQHDYLYVAQETTSDGQPAVLGWRRGQNILAGNLLMKWRVQNARIVLYRGSQQCANAYKCSVWRRPGCLCRSTSCRP